VTAYESIPWARPDYWGKEREYVAEALASTWISGGPFVDRLEREFARYCGTPRALTSSNGTTALHMALLALKVGRGDEVVVPGFGFLAAANIALHLGAIPVFAEVDPATWCVTAAEIERRLSPRTRAIVPVHTYGNVCAMGPIASLARTRGVAVIEDAAEALGSRLEDRLAGTMADVGCFSFQATKTITTGEGGMVVTANDELYETMWLYRNHGMLRKRYYWHELPGMNFRLTNLQAALGCAQLEQLDRIAAARQQVHAHYRRRLSDVPGLELQHFPAEVEPTLWAIAARLAPNAYPQGRDVVMGQMNQEGIETRPGFVAASRLGLYACPPLPICEELAEQVISLPSFPTLEEGQIARICATLERLRA